MSVLKQLYRRGSNFYSDSSEVKITDKTYTFTFNNPGWIAFDYMCDVALPSNGVIPKKYLKMTVNGTLRFEARASWAWQRHYVYVDEGTHKVRFYTQSYGSSDTAKVRRIVLTDFPKCHEYSMIESTTMPKPLNSINAFNILQGMQRYQRTGTAGTELEFTLIFDSMSKWRVFMRRLENFYIIKGDYGVYGGVILPQDVDTVRKGNLILTKCKLMSPMTAGVGVDGI